MAQAMFAKAALAISVITVLAQCVAPQARTFASPAPVIETGWSNPADRHHGVHRPMHPVSGEPIKTVTSGTPVTIAGLALTALSTPGHTHGALNWPCPIGAAGWRYIANPLPFGK